MTSRLAGRDSLDAMSRNIALAKENPVYERTIDGLETTLVVWDATDRPSGTKLTLQLTNLGWHAIASSPGVSFSTFAETESLAAVYALDGYLAIINAR